MSELNHETTNDVAYITEPTTTNHQENEHMNGHMNYDPEVHDNLERHELSEVQGDMKPEDSIQFRRSVEKIGYTQPVILLYENQILDGWHRYSLSQELGLTHQLRFVTIEGSRRDAFEAAFSTNQRKHQNPTEKAVAIVKQHFVCPDTGGVLQESRVGDYSIEELAGIGGTSETTIRHVIKCFEEGLGEEVSKPGAAVTRILKHKGYLKQTPTKVDPKVPGVCLFHNQEKMVFHALQSKDLFRRQRDHWVGANGCNMKLHKEITNDPSGWTITTHMMLVNGVSDKVAEESRKEVVLRLKTQYVGLGYTLLADVSDDE